MSALVLTVLICLAWAGITALGYLRGGWREIVTLAAILLAYAVASEWAAPNGRDLASVFGGNTYRSTTTIGLAYLFGGVALFGYFGGSRLPRPIPMSATERFVGGGVGLLNGGVLAALALRIVRSSAFGPGDGTVLQDATLTRLLIADIGYLLLIGLIAAAVAPFLSLLLVRQPPYTAEYTEDPALQPSPAFGYFPENHDGIAPTAYEMPYAAQYVPPGAPGMPVPFSPELMPDPAFLPPGSATAMMPATPQTARGGGDAPGVLLPTTPMAPRAVPAPAWPTPSLPVPVAAAVTPPAPPTPPTPPRDEAASGATATAASPGIPAPAGPPGFAITASQPLPVLHDAPPIPTPKPPAPVTASVPTLPASTVGPVPFTATRAVPPPTSAREAEPDAPGPDAARAPLPVADAATTVVTGGTQAPAAKAPDAPSSAPAPARDRIPTTPAPTSGLTPTTPALASGLIPTTPAPMQNLIPTTPVLPRVAEMPIPANLAALLAPSPVEPAPATTVPDAPDAAVPAPRTRLARARVATARPPEPPTPTANPALQRPVQPGPNMHPCPVCDYPVRNGARFCPNCGSSQPLA